jgi:hypothetical protein
MDQWRSTGGSLISSQSESQDLGLWGITLGTERTDRLPRSNRMRVPEEIFNASRR